MEAGRPQSLCRYGLGGPSPRRDELETASILVQLRAGSPNPCPGGGGWGAPILVEFEAASSCELLGGPNHCPVRNREGLGSLSSRAPAEVVKGLGGQSLSSWKPPQVLVQPPQIVKGWGKLVSSRERLGAQIHLQLETAPSRDGLRSRGPSVGNFAGFRIKVIDIYRQGCRSALQPSKACQGLAGAR